MTDESSATAQSDFVSIAVRLGCLSNAQARDMEQQASAQNVSVWQYGLEQGTLDSISVDIIKTLMAPRESIPGYEIVDLIGRGGMGVVYRARQISLNRMVALKTILLSQLSSSVAAQRFENEAQVLARVTHPHIVAAFDFGRHAGRLFLAMELVEGHDVERFIRQAGALSEYVVWHVIRQAAAGLAHASHADVIHRDIKPANLLLVAPPNGFPLPAGIPMVKIADFGLSILGEQQHESHDRLTSANVHVGSPVYMAPEQLSSGELDQRADIFALGATAWHMLVGRPPIQGYNLREIVVKRLTQPTEPLSKYVSNISPGTDALIAEMLTIEADDRIADYEQLLSRIDQILSQLPPHIESWQLDGSPASKQIAGLKTAEYSEAATQEIGSSISAGRNSATLLTPAAMSVSSTSSELVPPGRTRRLWLMVPLLMLVVAGGTAIFTQLPSQKPVRRETTTGPRTSLFDGQSLAGWRIVSGSWFPGADQEGAVVLQGANGELTTDLSAYEIVSFPNYFVVEASVSLLSAQGAGLALAGTLESNESYELIVELQADQLRIAARGGESKPTLEKIVTRASGKQLTSLRLEWQLERWWIVVNGQAEASLTTPALRGLEQLSLTAQGGTVHFSDVSIAALSVALGSELH